MLNTTKTVLIFGTGETLVSSPSGDQYWVTDQEGKTTPCSLQQACQLWQQYEQAQQIGPQQFECTASGAPPTTPSASTDGPEWEEYTPWQKDLLIKLGLTPDDVDPLATKKSV